jgi:hypothetical protein
MKSNKLIFSIAAAIMLAGIVDAQTPLVASLSSTNIKTGDIVVINGSNLMSLNTSGYSYSESNGSFEDGPIGGGVGHRC